MAYSVRKGKRKEKEWFLFDLKAQAISATLESLFHRLAIGLSTILVQLNCLPNRRIVTLLVQP